MQKRLIQNPGTPTDYRACFAKPSQDTAGATSLAAGAVGLLAALIAVVACIT